MTNRLRVILFDPSRTPVPTWHCPKCPEKFHTSDEYEAHKRTHEAN